MLPSKTIPAVNNRKGHALKPKTKAKTAAAPAKKKARTGSREVEEVEDDNSPRNITARNTTISPTGSFESFQIVNATKVSYLS
jgi:hypothetical protein